MHAKLSGWVGFVLGVFLLEGGVGCFAAGEVKVEAEEAIYEFGAANNGSGPLWCHGSTCLVRTGGEVFASGWEVVPEAKPLNNCRWTLFRRGAEGWKRVPVGDEGRTREPSPLAAFSDGRFWLSANPTLVTNLETYSGPARPEVLEFRAEGPDKFRRLEPVWKGAPRFSEHSYRSLAADGAGRELIVLQNIDYSHAEWSFLDREGRWTAQGQLKWPVENGKPIRLCYPNVALVNGAVYFFGTSDVVEPNEAWRAYKKELTGQEWDYTFRRLFYSWNADIRTNGFHEWLEVANVDGTGGGITLGDLWVAPDGAVHLLWSERKLDERLRAKFFPEQKQRHALVHAVVRGGRVAERQVLMEAKEGGAGEIPGRARFQITPENRVFVVFYVSGRDRQGRGVAENRVLELKPDGSASDAVRIPLEHPMSEFVTTTMRAGSPAAGSVEMMGISADSRNTIRYARVRLGL